MRSYRNSETPPPIMDGAPPPAEMRVPFLDWDRPPWNRWAFQRVRQILPTAPIRRGARVSPLPAARGGLDDFAFRRRDGTRTTFAEMLDATYTDAMWVWKDGHVLHESYHNGMDARTLHLLQSVSKSITATVSISPRNRESTGKGKRDLSPCTSAENGRAVQGRAGSPSECRAASNKFTL